MSDGQLYTLPTEVQAGLPVWSISCPHQTRQLVCTSQPLVPSDTPASWHPARTNAEQIIPHLFYLVVHLKESQKS